MRNQGPLRERDLEPEKFEVTFSARDRAARTRLPRRTNHLVMREIASVVRERCAREKDGTMAREGE